MRGTQGSPAQVNTTPAYHRSPLGKRKRSTDDVSAVSSCSDEEEEQACYSGDESRAEHQARHCLTPWVEPCVAFLANQLFDCLLRVYLRSDEVGGCSLSEMSRETGGGIPASSISDALHDNKYVRD